ncbi:MAG: hypothetical protein OEV30_06925 [Ignavibacteria bacterium]|nr:hypothetical protein [Ignavibacteria bacterium]
MKQLPVLFLLSSLSLYGLQAAAAQGTVVECPGTGLRFTCGESQVAICWVSNEGSAEECLTPPDGLSGLPLDLWLLSYVLDDTLTVTTMSVGKYLNILEKGRWESGDYRVTFTLPADWNGTRSRAREEGRE